MAADDTKTTIHARLDAATAEWLSVRADLMHTGSENLQARQELGIWRTALNAELRRIRLTLNQANCIADVLNGTMMTAGIAGGVPLVYTEMVDAFAIADSPIPYAEAGYGAKWDINEQDLLTYLVRLGPTADHALHDAVARWWKGGHDASITGWAAVALTVVPDAETTSIQE